jgi:glycosyltransferase involved in cell wall biosynthesis
MRVTIVHSFYRSSAPSGENVAVENQIELLESAGHEVQLIKLESDSLTLASSAKLALSVSTFGGANPLKEISEFVPDIVHIHNLFPNFGQKWIQELPFPSVATLHNFRPLCAAGTFSRDGKDCFDCPTKGSHSAVVNRCYKNSALMSIPLAVATRDSGSRNPVLNSANTKIVLSNFAKEMYQANFSADLKLKVLPNFAKRSDNENAHAVKSDSNYWIYIGRLSSEKGISELLEHWPPNQNLRIYGSGPLDNELKRLHSKKANISFCGALHPDNRHEALSGSLGLVFPSTCRENSPLVVGEAYSSGVPVVAFAGNVIGEIISQSGGGSVFESFRDLSAVLEGFEQIRSQQVVRVKEIYDSVYSPESWLRNILSIYRDAIESYKTT